MLERTDATTKEFLETITFVLAYPTVFVGPQYRTCFISLLAPKILKFLLGFFFFNLCTPSLRFVSAFTRSRHFFFFQALNFLVESFGLLNDLFPFPPILDAGYPVFDLHLANVLFLTFQLPVHYLLVVFLLHSLSSASI